MANPPVSVPTDDPEAAPDDGAGEGPAEPTVLCTVLMNADGTFQLIKGDEPEGGEGEQPAAGAGEDGAGEAAEPAAKGEAYDSPGSLLKAILDILKDAQSNGEGSADENFAAGYAGGSGASPARTPMAPQKY